MAPVGRARDRVALRLDALPDDGQRLGEALGLLERSVAEVDDPAARPLLGALGQVPADQVRPDDVAPLSAPALQQLLGLPGVED